jgi:hypothetical protein
MKQQEFQKLWELLDEIPQEDPPPFLWTRIQGRISRVRETTVRPGWVLMAFASVGLLLLLNLMVIRRSVQASEAPRSGQSFEFLLPDNGLYQ